MSLTVPRDVILVRLGGLEGGGASEKFVRPLGFVRTVHNLVVGLGLIGVAWCVSVRELAAYLETVSLSNQPIVDTLKRNMKMYQEL